MIKRKRIADGYYPYPKYKCKCDDVFRCPEAVRLWNIVNIEYAKAVKSNDDSNYEKAKSEYYNHLKRCS